MKTKIYSDRLFCAVDPTRQRSREILGKQHAKAFLHRQTGDIVFFDAGGRCMDDWAGMGAAVDMVFDQATVEAAPEKWIAIPTAPDVNLDTFINAFLWTNRIDAELV